MASKEGGPSPLAADTCASGTFSNSIKGLKAEAAGADNLVTVDVCVPLAVACPALHQLDNAKTEPNEGNKRTLQSYDFGEIYLDGSCGPPSPHRHSSSKGLSAAVSCCFGNLFWHTK